MQYYLLSSVLEYLAQYQAGKLTQKKKIILDQQSPNFFDCAPLAVKNCEHASPVCEHLFIYELYTHTSEVLIFFLHPSGLSCIPVPPTLETTDLTYWNNLLVEGASQQLVIETSHESF